VISSSGYDRWTSRRWRALAACLVGIAGFAAAPTASANGTGQPSAAEIQRALDDVVTAGAPGALALVRSGDRTLRLTSGYGNLAPQTPIRVSDRTRIGGLSKSFTATVVLQLVGERRLALDDTLERWLPGVISNGAAITVRQLLNHTSGIYDYAGDPTVLAPYLSGDLTHIFDPQFGVQVAAAHGPLFPPGSALAYSNTNTLLLAMIVERVTGNSFPSELRRRIVKPLGLRDTSYPMSSEIGGSHVHGYLIFEEGPFDVTPWSPTLFGAGGAILSNVDDVADFYRALLRKRLVSQRLLKAMKTIDPAATGGVPDAGILGGGWGLGLLREEFPCGEAWGHDSETPGYMTAAWNSKNGNHQVVVVVNSSFSHDEPVSEAMRAVLTTAYCGRR
jgi:D-alanyl-D-alanine carboxypeptidase